MIATVLVGAATYAALLLGSWIAVGRPEGPERMVAERLAPVARRLGWG